MAKQHTKSARRRAKQVRACETVDAIVEAAARVVLREGYPRSSTNRIAEAAGVSIGTLYQYFSDKDEVFDALIRREIQAMRMAVLEDAVHPAESLEETIHRLLQLALHAQRHGPELYRRLDHIPGAVFRLRLAELRTQVIAAVRGILATHADELRVTDLDLAAFVVTAAAEGVGYSASGRHAGQPLVSELTDLFTRYLAGAAS